MILYQCWFPKDQEHLRQYLQNIARKLGIPEIKRHVFLGRKGIYQFLIQNYNDMYYMITIASHCNSHINVDLDFAEEGESKIISN